jgi:hypothetical protein
MNYSDEALRWLIGIEITVALTLVGALLAAFYRLADAIRKGDDALHERVNDVRDQYVRRSDLDGHMARIDGSMHDLRSDMKEQHRDTQRRLDSVLAALKCAIPPHKEN